MKKFNLAYIDLEDLINSMEYNPSMDRYLLTEEIYMNAIVDCPTYGYSEREAICRVIAKMHSKRLLFIQEKIRILKPWFTEVKKDWKTWVQLKKVRFNSVDLKFFLHSLDGKIIVVNICSYRIDYLLKYYRKYP